ncbi:DUF502 domain-containing protein [Hyphomonas johnsonii]|jgi:uncharacterized membrane protein|uniref:DUF502 domain-containing protein n=1 Tax=Hyphomonas johnsonii MHS-2 TaxID=1280950 RepID=A0A059FVG4_9PROT|nr:DUF502 domain-containing protein [Hyphomonas johnsonii]KCZ94664.1 hypothetical protein HJO_04780 [Hyphomonas johnsonii MHS-2]
MARKKDPDMGRLPGEAPPTQSLFGWLRGRFFAGMVIAAPIAVTFLILQFLIGEIDKRVVPLIPAALNPETYLKYAVPGFGLIVLVVFLTILGAITTNLIGRSVVGIGDRVLSRVPIVRSLYSAFKQLVEVFAKDNTDQFSEVVLIEYPKPGTWCLGFVSSAARGEIGAALGHEFLGIFVPTTPNPTSGFLMYVHAKEVIRLGMTVEEGAKMILSAGLVVPEFPPAAKPEGGSGSRNRTIVGK